MANQNQLAAILRQMQARQAQLEQNLTDVLKAVMSAPRSITEEIDALPGRRLFYNLSDTVTFDAQDDGQRGDPLQFLVSQDGPYVMTHYPVVSWRPSAPANATNFGQWSAIYSWPLPTQNTANRDSINLSYEIQDTGSQRNFQNAPAAPLLSRFDAALPLPVPTLFSPNTVVVFTPTYEDILFNGSAAIPATEGTLVVTLPGYRIINS